ncbi:MAG TPA: hypothetical protein VKA05_03790 [Acidimicrobiales bacterium]|nr:hypothetical protein [Acidimicrobiales bacterium]
MSIVSRIAVAGAVAALAFGATGVASEAATPSHASARHPIGSSSALGLHGRFGRAEPAVGLSTSLAGYLGTPTLGIASVSASFTAPSFSCGSRSDTEDIAFGPFVYDSSMNVEASADVQPVCENNTLYYFLSAYTVGGGDNLAYTVHPGDHIIASISESPSGMTTVTITDVNTATVETSQQATDANDTYVSVGVVNYEPDVPRFSAVKETSVQIDGQYLGQAGLQPYNLQTSGDVQIKTNKVATYSETLKLTFENNF